MYLIPTHSLTDRDSYLPPHLASRLGMGSTPDVDLSSSRVSCGRSSPLPLALLTDREPSCMVTKARCAHQA